MKVLVLGAGVIGTSTAWYLTDHAHELTDVHHPQAPSIETT